MVALIFFHNLVSATSIPSLRLFLMDRNENYIVWAVYDYHTLSSFFPGGEDPTAPT